MDHGMNAAGAGYEPPSISDYGSLAQMTAGCLGPGQDDAGFPDQQDIFPSESPAFGDPGFCV
jgi:hypothetical protein